jgi:hypothetical protein
MPAYQLDLRSGLALGLDCPFPQVPLRLSTLRGRFEVGFVLDTGAAVSLFPIPMADELGVYYDPDADGGADAPRTLLGRLAGCRGTLDVRLGATDLALPCIFYRLPDEPAPEMEGGPGRRTAIPPAESLADWEGRSGGPPGSAAAPPPRPRRYRCVLGRLGFLNRVDLLFRRDSFVISTHPDRIALPPGPSSLAPTPPRPPRRRR